MFKFHLKPFLFFAFFLSFILGVYGQQSNYIISGSIRDAATGEDLPGASLSVKSDLGFGASSNAYGFYSLELPAGTYVLVYSYIGYQSKEIDIHLTSNQRITIELLPITAELNEIEVIAEQEDRNVRSNEMTVTSVNVKEIESIPVLFGEKDIFKTLQLTPGVKPAGEGSSGFYVRGGTSDENLILLDEAPVYNASHMMGFFSIFNSDAIRDVKLYKGSMGAEFGGRLSSVLDIKMKEGNAKTLAVNGGIGLISSRLTIESPFAKNKGSFIVSARRTYADLFAVFAQDEAIQNAQLYFYDLNLKGNIRLGEKDRIFISGYFGRDKFGYDEHFGFNWGNATTTTRWNHIYNPKLFSNTSIIFSKYSYQILAGPKDTRVEIGSNIIDYNLKHDYQFYQNDHSTWKFGFDMIHHTMNPGDLNSDQNELYNSLELEDRYALESAIYIANERKLNAKLSFNYGLRFSNFTQFGPGTISAFNTFGDVIASTEYQPWEKVVNYSGLEPRVNLAWLINSFSSFKMFYSNSKQYMHLLSNSSSDSPTDIWLPSSNNIKPSTSNQIGLGYYRNFNQNAIEFSVETYFKTMSDIIDYKIDAQVTLNPMVEGDLVFGEGRAYGLELFLKKRKGRLSGWFGYTLSRTERRFEEIDHFAWYPAKQDRTHDFSIVAMFNLTDKIQFSGSWVFYTGNAITFPEGKYEINGQDILLYSTRNAYRMPNYHRLDIGFSLKNKEYKQVFDEASSTFVQQKKRFRSSWNFSIYNAYNRENAYSITFEPNENNPQVIEAVQLSLFKLIPSITYNFSF
ncbi:MAG: TonB-dependent receptor [Bacteroidales bacterium]|nr:TonB-dependent receptor [Bacteroidales bacterium]